MNLDENLSKLLIEIMTIRSAEKVLHEWNDIEHKEACIVCKGLCDFSVGITLDLYFCILGKMYFAMFNLGDDKGAWCAANFPIDKLETPCGICNGIMEYHENAIALPFCDHVFHEYCLYGLIYRSIFNDTERLVCPCENCDKIVFLSYADQINASTPVPED